MSRVPDFPVEPQFPARHSPRAMSGEIVPLKTLYSLIEAARWAPSAGNTQPWRFGLAPNNTPLFSALLESLDEGNRLWNVRSGALVAVCAKTKKDDGGALGMHAFDTGAAWMALALQGKSMGLVTHAMGGFDRGLARAALGLPEDIAILCLVAVGHPGDVSLLPDYQQPREVPSGRLPTLELVLKTS